MNSISKDLTVHTFPCLSDNYGFLVHDPVSGQTASIDTPDAHEIARQLENLNWSLDYIFNTHHHHDHVGGNLELKERYHCTIFGSKYDRQRIPGIDKTLENGDTIALGEHTAQVYETPGHTLGHIIYHFADDKKLFVGDTLFALGCGRLFEGTADQMYQSLQLIKQLDDETMIYCAHEYTEANAMFAKSLDDHPKPLETRYQEIIDLRRNNLATVPFVLGEDKKTNPFLLASNPNEFAERRKLKDQF